MKCENVKEFLQDFLYEEGPPEERNRIREHLVSCEACGDEHALLMDLKGLLNRWETPGVPDGLAERVLSETVPVTSRSFVGRLINRRFGLSFGAQRASVSAAGGILFAVLGVLLASKGATGEIPLNLQVVCGIYWAVAFGSLFWGALRNQRRARNEGVSNEKTLEYRLICASALAALGLGGLVAYGNILLGVEPVRRFQQIVAPWQAGSFPLALSFFLIGGSFALVSQFLGALAIAKRPGGRPLEFGLATGCIFTLIVAPALSIVCVPFTLGFFASAFAGCLLGAVTGGTLAVRLRTAGGGIHASA